MLRTREIEQSHPTLNLRGPNNTANGSDSTDLRLRIEAVHAQALRTLAPKFNMLPPIPLQVWLANDGASAMGMQDAIKVPSFFRRPIDAERACVTQTGQYLHKAWANSRSVQWSRSPQFNGSEHKNRVAVAVLSNFAYFEEANRFLELSSSGLNAAERAMEKILIGLFLDSESALKISLSSGYERSELFVQWSRLYSLR